MEITTGISQVADVCVVGAGYIGYPLSLVLADAGHRVVAVDRSPEVVDSIRRGQPRTTEASVFELARSPRVQSHLTADTAIPRARAYVIAVPTPIIETTREADLSYVLAAVDAIAERIEDGCLVVLESTVPPGTTETLLPRLTAWLDEGERVFVAHCPERLHPGATLEELVFNDRIIGGIDQDSVEATRELYATFVQGELIETDATTAELCKLFENTYRDVNLALANQMAGIAEHLGVDPVVALEMASRHPRVDYLRPSIGVGGHCIPVDPWFLHQSAPEISSMIAAARQANLDRETLTASRIRQLLPDDGPVVVLAGVAYKPDVADARQSPALRIRDLLVGEGVEVRMHDPVVGHQNGSLAHTARGADLIAVTVGHTKMTEALRAARDEVEAAMRHPLILDFSFGFPRALG